MTSLVIKNAQIVNEGEIRTSDIHIKGQRIEKIAPSISPQEKHQVIDAEGLYLFPGVIDDQVHFREPGLTHKGEIYTEARAGVAGGTTSYMEMPNTNPQSVTQELLEEKYQIAAKRSLGNYSFYIGATNDNLEDVLKTDTKNVCGIKVFMGSSTGNMLVDNPNTLERLFSSADMLIATHCEDEATIRENSELYKIQFGDDVPMRFHPQIRSEEACYISSSMAVDLAKKHNTRLHILHISTAKELSLFKNDIHRSQKRITSEACIHHLWFEQSDYDTKGSYIKWNPAVKTKTDRDAIFQAVLDGRIDVIATDHAPHTIEEKSQSYWKCPSGGPLIQHSLLAMLEKHTQGKISLEKIADKMSHAVADIFQISERGYIREGYFADLVLVNLTKPYEVTKASILSKCGWSPFEGTTFGSSITHTIVSGHIAFERGVLNESVQGMRMSFDR